ncbi:G2/M phase-specific E3 ubiquitin-protein ligase-like isoform X2 [Clavelina lepadiformis]
MRMHYFCLLLASGLPQSLHYAVDDFTVEKDSVCGFLVKDIIQEVKRASRLRCVYCHKSGASIGCVVTTCKSKFHHSCGLENGVLSQFYQSFRSYCSRHRPKQVIKTVGEVLKETGNVIEEEKVLMPQMKSVKSVNTQSCAVCLDDVQCSATDLHSLTTPCCMSVWLHRSCVQQQALSSGVHFFRCPVCNDAQLFKQEMQRMGIYVPERDASWELTSDAFNDLLQRHSQCDVKECQCPHGRDYNLKGSEWAVVLCDLCGSSGTHIACNEDVDSETSYHVCDLCLDIHGVDGAQKLAEQMGVLSPEERKVRRSDRIRWKSTTASPALKRRRFSSEEFVCENEVTPTSSTSCGRRS